MGGGVRVRCSGVCLAGWLGRGRCSVEGCGTGGAEREGAVLWICLLGLHGAVDGWRRVEVVACSRTS